MSPHIYIELTSVSIATPRNLVTPAMGSLPQRTADLVLEHFEFRHLEF